jgi:hypothetical protein
VNYTVAGNRDAVSRADACKPLNQREMQNQKIDWSNH